ncbi:PhnD/SsuA/transferrin family substrate-binding protein [Caldalkalibacillus horti]|uniref:Phosphonate transport system substrate-binding protein n=1 Tax=Caldalkalibacillus horti TaxID=77523 RepID=A0ABT9W1E8_9BACI|nr:PhnD/SsuA/transferrin family substrate-binding protein [Bacillus horti]MDQ0167036.1 phosphonate transport system substrate-binding protein [Bacillus horti]
MKRSYLFFVFAVLASFALLAGCSSSSDTGANEPSGNNSQQENPSTGAETPAAEEGGTITIVWYPNESGADLKDARDAIAELVEDATGKTVEHRTTTDYIIAIETIANGNADLAFMGAVGYIEANNRNSNVLPIAVPSGSSGTLDDAVYYSWLAVKKGNEDQYKDGDQFSIENIVDKRFSFVSNSSTSGFVVPSTGIVDYFSNTDEFKDLTSDDLLEGGDFFSEVSYGGSHQGSAVNLLTDRVDIAAFCDTCVNNYVELLEGEENRPGSVYGVRADAAEPFNTIPGEEFVLISVTPVLNAPFVANRDNVSDADFAAIVAAFTSDEAANNEQIFVPRDTGATGLFSKSADERFIQVEDAWFNPIRELSN